MSNVIYNPSQFSLEQNITENSSLKFFLTNVDFKGEQVLSFTVLENQELDFVLLDFANADLDLTVDVNLQRNASVSLHLAALSSQDYKKNFHFNVNHLDVDSKSLVVMSGINSGNGTLRFLGNSYIKNGAHRSQTRQEGKITNLSATCKSEASPSLLIKENDVVASHGAALGAYNPTQLYYLMSRGLSLAESKKLITYGTLLPIIEKLEDATYIEEAKKALEDLSL